MTASTHHGFMPILLILLTLSIAPMLLALSMTAILLAPSVTPLCIGERKLDRHRHTKMGIFMRQQTCASSCAHTCVCLEHAHLHAHTRTCLASCIPLSPLTSPSNSASDRHSGATSSPAGGLSTTCVTRQRGGGQRNMDEVITRQCDVDEVMLYMTVR